MNLLRCTPHPSLLPACGEKEKEAEVVSRFKGEAREILQGSLSREAVEGRGEGVNPKAFGETASPNTKVLGERFNNVALGRADSIIVRRRGRIIL